MDGPRQPADHGRHRDDRVHLQREQPGPPAHGREVVMEDVQLLIGGQNRAAADNATFTRLNPVTGEVATRASAASVADARAAADAAAAAFPNGRRSVRTNGAAGWSRPPSCSSSARRSSPPSAAPRRARPSAGDISTCTSPPRMLREAAAMTTQVTGEVVPSDVPGSLAMAHPPAGRRRARHRAVERRRSSWACAPWRCRWPAAIP